MDLKGNKISFFSAGEEFIQTSPLVIWVSWGRRSQLLHTAGAETHVHAHTEWFFFLLRSLCVLAAELCLRSGEYFAVSLLFLTAQKRVGGPASAAVHDGARLASLRS